MSDSKFPDKLYLKENGPLLPGKRRSSVNRVLLFLTILFALAAVALAAVLAITVLKGDHEDDNRDSPRLSGRQMNQQLPKLNQQSPNLNQQLPKLNLQAPATACPTPAPTEPPKTEDVCLTPGCVLAAARVQSRIDLSVNPCDDFFNFACGSWIQENVIPEDKSLLNTMDEVSDSVSVKLKGLLEEDKKASESASIQKAKDYYKECMDTAKVEELGTDAILDYMVTFGGWPVLGTNKGGNWDENAYNFEDLMLKITPFKGVMDWFANAYRIPLIDILVGQDALNPDKNILMMEQPPSLGMPNRDYFLKARNDRTLMAYQKFIKDIAMTFGADETTADTDTKEVVDLEIDLAKITVRVEDMRNPLERYNKMKVGELSKNFTGIDWMKLVKGTFQLANMTIDKNEPIIVTTPEYFEKLEATLQKHGPRAVANYVIWRIIMEHLFYFPVKFTDIRMEYNKVLVGTASRLPRWQSCGDNVVDLMSQVAGRLFVEAYFSEDAKLDVLTMIENLRLSLKEMITDLDWMGESTKTSAKEKADTLEPRIGYPDWIYDADKLNERYEEVTVYPNELLRTYISFGEADGKYNLRQLRKPHDKSFWMMSAAAVNAYYDPGTNQITFPAGILQPPFYTKDQPQYLNYGGIGDVIGHEMTHGFDDQGRVYDKDGNLNDWWTPTDEKKFKEKAQCIIDQYGSYVVPGTGNMTLNGINTQGENMADNGGIKESFKAYRKWVSTNGTEEPKLPGLPYTSSQLYFLNAAQVWCSKYRNQEKIRRIRIDPHSLAMYRVYGPMQNFDEFSKAFDCPVGSFMNPQNKCAVW